MFTVKQIEKSPFFIIGKEDELKKNSYPVPIYGILRVKGASYCSVVNIIEMSSEVINSGELSHLESLAEEIMWSGVK